MAFSSRVAGVTTRSNPKTEHLDQGQNNLARGVVIFVDGANGAVIVPASNSAPIKHGQFFVTTIAQDNSSGVVGDLKIAAVGTNEFVTVKVSPSFSGIIHAGQAVMVSNGPPGVIEDGTVELWDEGDESTIVGTYLRKEGGIIARDASTPFTETLTDKGDFGVGPTLATTAGQVIEIQVK